MIDFKSLKNIDDALDMVGLLRKEKSAGAGTFFIGLGVGLLAGGAAALLLAPYNGTEAREKLARAGEDFGRTASTRVNELVSTIREKAEQKGIGSSSMNDNGYGSSISSGTRVGV